MLTPVGSTVTDAMRLVNGGSERSLGEYVRLAHFQGGRLELLDIRVAIGELVSYQRSMAAHCRDKPVASKDSTHVGGRGSDDQAIEGFRVG